MSIKPSVPAIFLDANIIFSACHSPEGRSARLLAIGRLGLCRLGTTAYAIEEARRSLEEAGDQGLKHLPLVLEDLKQLRGASVQGIALVANYLKDPDDLPILAAAIERHADYLTTGDLRHFGHLMGKVIEGVKVLSLADTLALFLK